MCQPERLIYGLADFRGDAEANKLWIRTLHPYPAKSGMLERELVATPSIDTLYQSFKDHSAHTHQPYSIKWQQINSIFQNLRYWHERDFDRVLSVPLDQYLIGKG